MEHSDPAPPTGSVAMPTQLTSSDKEVLRVVLSIGPTEAMHFQTWQDKAGNATPLTDTDPVTGSVVTFVDLATGQPQSLQANLIMPEPCPFLNTS